MRRNRWPAMPVDSGCPVTLSQAGSRERGVWNAAMAGMGWLIDQRRCVTFGDSGVLMRRLPSGQNGGVGMGALGRRPTPCLDPREDAVGTQGTEGTDLETPGRCRLAHARGPKSRLRQDVRSRTAKSWLDACFMSKVCGGKAGALNGLAPAREWPGCGTAIAQATDRSPTGGIGG